jgi:hypothetical protein
VSEAAEGEVIGVGEGGKAGTEFSFVGPAEGVAADESGEVDVLVIRN